MKSPQRSLSATILLIATSALPLIIPVTAVAGVSVVNGDFEQDAGLFTVSPGYTGNGNPAEIQGWQGQGRLGINPLSPGGEAPFADNGYHATSFAFLHPSGIEGGSLASISQEVSGFDVGSKYLLSLDFNASACCWGWGPPVPRDPRMTISLNDIPIADFGVGAVGEHGSLPQIYPWDYYYLDHTTPWYHIDIPFTASEENINLKFVGANASYGVTSATILLDNITITAVPEPAEAGIAVAVFLAAFVLYRRRV